MIIDERGLCRAMKRAWKTGGYTVAGDPGRISLWAEEWFVQIGTKDMPKKVLALIVEHMGALPGESTRLQKGTPPQLELEDTAGAEMNYWLNVREVVETRKAAAVLDGWQILQEVESCRCWAADPESLDIVEAAAQKQMAGLLSKDRVIYAHEDEFAALSVTRPADDALWFCKAWAALEEVKMV